MSADRFPHAESELVSRLGLARKRVRDVRAAALVRGDDWTHTGGMVRYSEEGQKKLLAALSVPPDGAAVPPPAAPAAPAAAPEHLAPKKTEEPAPAEGEPKPGDAHELVVTKKFLNRAIVQARFGKTLVRVRVKDSRKLVSGMFIRCQHIEKDLWKMTERLPRFPGKR